MKYALWNSIDKFLAVDRVNKKYYFTQDKNDPNLIIKNQISMLTLTTFESKANKELYWYPL